MRSIMLQLVCNCVILHVAPPPDLWQSRQLVRSSSERRQFSRWSTGRREEDLWPTKSNSRSRSPAQLITLYIYSLRLNMNQLKARFGLELLGNNAGGNIVFWNSIQTQMKDATYTSSHLQVIGSLGELMMTFIASSPADIEYELVK